MSSIHTKTNSASESEFNDDYDLLASGVGSFVRPKDDITLNYILALGRNKG